MLLAREQAPSRQELREHIDRFPFTRVGVVGDLILDEYLWGAASRISPEAPVPVVEVQQETRMPGGAANVVANMTSLGARPLLCGVVGDDEAGRELLDWLRQKGLPTEGVICEPGRPTSIKTRVVAQHQQVVRFDRETRRSILPDTLEALTGYITAVCHDLDVLVVSDYGKGVISGSLMAALGRVLRSTGIKVAVDPKINNFAHYRGVDVITPNHHEASQYCGFPVSDEESLQAAGKQMLESLECRCVLITQGPQGMTLFQKNGLPTRIPTVARRVFDVTGAGDTVIATFSLAIGSGLDPLAAAVLSNCAAGIVVGEVGTAAVKADELKGLLKNVVFPALEK